MRLGAWLLNKGRITEDQLQKALQHKEFFGGRLGSSLIALGYVDEDVLGAYLSDVSGTPYAPASRLDNVPPEVIALLPGRLAGQYRAVPIGAEGRRLRLAMRDPRDLIALDEIAFMTGMTVEPYVSTEFRVRKALARYYQMGSGTEAVPLAPGAAVASPPAPATPPAVTGGTPAPRSGEIGFDGYPIDADPDQIDPADPRHMPGSRAVPGDEDLPPPTSLDEWRQAQEEMPEEFPEAQAPRRLAGAPLAAGFAVTTPRTSPEAERAPARVAAKAPAGTLDAAAARLQAAQTRDEVFETILSFTAARFRRCALFIVYADKIAGWGGRGEGIDAERVRDIVVPLDRPSIFSFLRTGAEQYEGPVGSLPANTRFFLDLRVPAPARAVLLPLRIKDRPTLVLYADNGDQPGGASEIPNLRRLLAKSALALEILILRSKIPSL